jgi:hypothetical protein
MKAGVLTAIACTSEISPAEKSVAVDLTQKLRAELKPIPTIWDMRTSALPRPLRAGALPTPS